LVAVEGTVECGKGAGRKKRKTTVTRPENRAIRQGKGWREIVSESGD
jgi:hypothetical protein